MSALTTAKQLKILLEGVEYNITGDFEKTEITGLCSDSRKVQPGNMFAALKGLSVDGHNYLDQAVAAGCSALLVNQGWQEYVKYEVWINIPGPVQRLSKKVHIQVYATYMPGSKPAEPLGNAQSKSNDQQGYGKGKGTFP